MIDLLASLYDPFSAKRVAHDAKLPENEIDFNGSSLECWESIWTKATECDKTHALMAVVAKEYPKAVEKYLNESGWTLAGEKCFLRDKLARIYSTPDDVRTVAEEVGLNIIHLRISTHPKNTWHDVITHAGWQGTIHKFLPYATAEAKKLYGRTTCGYCTAVHESNECPKCGAPRESS
jgi:hypothetical protein